jgi:transcription elongation GreA/GreB family factor
LKEGTLDSALERLPSLQLSPSTDDTNKRSLLSRVIEVHPEALSLTNAEPPKADSTLFVSWSSLNRRKSEYQELISKKIPANKRVLALVRGYGNLRENHKFKAAKETERELMRRKTELERQLERARAIDFLNVRTDVVGVGTSVTIIDIDSKEFETITIAGAWDSDSERRVISYLEPLAQKLLNRAPGESVAITTNIGMRKVVIERVEPAQASNLSERPICRQTR